MSLVDSYVGIGADYLNFLPSFYLSDPDSFSKETRMSQMGFLKAAKIAVKSSYRNKFIRSIFKYELGCKIHSNNPMRIDPKEKYIPISNAFDDDKIRYAYAILVPKLSDSNL